jgi:threonine synthase
LKTGEYKAKQATATISNAMDVGNPSNFVRILELFNHEFDGLKKVLSSYTISDKETRSAIANVLRQHDYLLDPHGAVGYLALQRFLEDNAGLKGIFLETAHPVKFYDVVELVTGQPVPIPVSVEGIMNNEKKSVKIDTEYEELKKFVISL